MNYELVKKLKDAGFTQDGNGVWINDREQVAGVPIWSMSHVYIPTLSELIEACGGAFYQLTKEKLWFVEADQIGIDGRFFGSTPEEAVANLWLELNK